MYVKVKNGQVEQYPYTVDDLRRDNPNTSFPNVLSDQLLSEFNASTVVVTGAPAYNPMTHQAVQSGCTFHTGRMRWEMTWTIEPLTPEQIAEKQAQLQSQIVQQTQARLDDFARTRGYDGILSACTYATSSVPKFQAEGHYCVDARDATWSALYKMLAEVQAGTRPVPSGYEDIEPDLPDLVWPV